MTDKPSIKTDQPSIKTDQPSIKTDQPATKTDTPLEEKDIKEDNPSLSTVLSDEDKKYVERGKKHRKPRCKKVIRLSQADFSAGTRVVLQQPNTCYLLTENVSFAAQSSSVAVQIAANNIAFDLGGHTITGVGPNAAFAIIIRYVSVPAIIINTYIHNGSIKGFSRGVYCIASTINLTAKKLTISSLTDSTGSKNPEGLLVVRSTNFLVSHCKIFSVNGSASASGMSITDSSGSVRKNCIFDISGVPPFASATGIFCSFSTFTAVARINMAFNKISNITGLSATGLFIFSSIPTRVNDTIIYGVHATGPDQPAVGVSIEGTAKTVLEKVKVKNVTSIVTDRSSNLASGFSLSLSGASLIDCKSSSIKSITK